MVTLGIVFKFALLIANAFAVLHEERFLNKVGLSEQEVALEAGFKLQIVNLLKGFRLMRIPIIIINTVTVLFLVVIG